MGKTKSARLPSSRRRRSQQGVRPKWKITNAHREQFFSLSVDMLCIASSDGYFKWLNEPFTEALGWTTDELTSRPFADFVHPDDLARTMHEVERQVIAGETVLHFENRYRHKNGSWRNLLWTSVPQGQLMFATARDVTERNRLEEALHQTNGRLEQIVEERTSALGASERQFRLLVSSIKDYGLCMLDRDGKVSSWNAGAERIKGYSAEEIIGKNFACFYTEEDRAAGLPRIVLDTAAESGKYEIDGCWRVRKDGSRFWASLIVYPIRSESGMLTNFAKITRDITAQHEAEIANKKLQKQLAQSQKMEAIGQLTGGVAHDFNNILTVILANADTLAEHIEDHNLRELAEMMRTAAERGTELTNNLLAFARRQPLEPKVVGANELLVGMDKLLRHALGEQIEIKFVKGAALWQLSVDPTQLESALLNLAINARDAMPGGGRLTVETINTFIDEKRSADYDDVPPGEYVLISVSDTGTGMTPETASRVFEPFFTTKEFGKGTGLGLSMVYGFVKQSGGHIKIYSEVGHGTSFKIYLPRSLDAKEPTAAGVIAKPHDPIGSETILLAEDDALVRQHGVNLLRGLGYQVLIAANGAEALAILERGDHVDLLFTDVVMPGGMSGRQLADKAAALRPSLKILFTSGYPESAIVHHGRLDPGIHLMKKPYRRRDLALKLRELLGPTAASQTVPARRSI